MGAVIIAPSDDDGLVSTNATTKTTSGERLMRIPFQNEYLYAALTADGTEDNMEVVCTVPELISIIGQDGEAIGSQDLRFGLRVDVIGLPAHPLWKTPAGLKVGGPEGFGLDIPFVALSQEFTEARSVINEFSAR